MRQEHHAISTHTGGDDMSKADKIRALNDRLRTTFLGGRGMLSAAVAELSLEVRSRLMKVVREFNKFDEDNDPHHEHDCFLFDFEGERYAVKIDYYDRKTEFGSEDPSNPEVTTRVMTI